jgi:cell division transport system permease protein
MNLAQLGFIGRRVRNSLWQLIWTHALTATTLAMTLFVFGFFILVQENLEALLNRWGDQLQINAYVDKAVSSDEVGALQTRIENFPEVAAVRLISQEQAWRDFQVALGSHSSVLEGLPRDVLPASFEISLRAAFRDQPLVESLAGRLRREKGITGVEYAQDWVERLNLIILGLQWAKWIFGGVLFLVTYSIVSSTVKLAILGRREEIEIMQLVGASPDMIQAPFLLEGMIQGLFGGALAVGALWLGFYFLRDALGSSLALFGASQTVRFLSLQSVATVLLLAWILGGAGSVFSLRAFLRTWKG